ncbi:MAG: hypothetical protein ACW98U_09560 [Candidatus Thorarchaeota archaeon]|jgi:hypothetical protein
MKAKFKSKYKSTITIAIFLVLVNTMVLAVPVEAADPSRILMIDIMAKGPDFDVPGAISSIKGTIEYNKDTGECLGQLEFNLKLYDESGKKIYSLKGKLKDAAVIPGFVFPCDVRNVIWINLWLVTGEGEIKTSDTDMEIEYRGNTITLPNTKGQYMTMPLVMLVSQYGEHAEGFWEEGGWAAAGMLGWFGAGTYLTKYMVKMVP